MLSVIRFAETAFVAFFSVSKTKEQLYPVNPVILSKKIVALCELIFFFINGYLWRDKFAQFGFNKVLFGVGG